MRETKKYHGGGACRKVEVFTKEIGSKDTSKEKWEKRIQETTMADNYDVAFTDGSKLENGKTERDGRSGTNSMEGKG